MSRPINTSLQVHLAALAEQLIKACGGYIAAALECDVSKSQLERAANANNAYSLKSSTIWHLEQACGRPIMSRALLDMHSAPPAPAGCPVFISIDYADRATDLTVAVHSAVKDGVLTVYEMRDLTGRTSDMKKRFTGLCNALRVRKPKSLEPAK